MIIKNYVSLERYNKKFYPLQPDKFEDIRHLVEFFSTDYRDYDESYYEQVLSFYNSSFIYHDIAQKTLHIGFSEWEINTDIPVPCDHAFPSYLNQINNCSIHIDNYKELRKNLTVLKQESPFALIYRDDQNLIDCKGFNCQKEMEFFLNNHTKN